MGPSGSGKSTLMHILAGLDKPTSGTVTIAGTEITTLGDNDLTKLRREHIGFVFQFFNLLPMLDAEENILLPLTIAGEKPDAAWFEQLIESVGLGRSALAPPGRALRRPAAARRDRAGARLAADGPLRRRADRQPRLDDGRRDPRAAAPLGATSYGQTIVMVTHEARAAAIADRVLFLADGARRARGRRAPRRTRSSPRWRSSRSVIEVRPPRPARAQAPHALTAIAIVLGVAMISGTYVLTDSIDQAFDGIFTRGLRGHERRRSPARRRSTCADGSGVDRAAVRRVAARRGARSSTPSRRDRQRRQRVDAADRRRRQGDRLRRRAEPRLQRRSDGKPQFNPLTLVERHLAEADEVVIDEATADKEDFEVGQTIGVQAEGPVERMRISGHRPASARARLDRRRDARRLRPADGAAALRQGGQARRDRASPRSRASRPQQLVARDRRRSCRRARQVRTADGSRRATTPRTRTSSSPSSRGFLLAFGGIALFVGSFVIANSLSITIAQRTREFATLRTIGASRRQVLGSVIVEALVVGVVASVVGLFLGLAPREGALPALRRRRLHAAEHRARSSSRGRSSSRSPSASSSRCSRASARRSARRACRRSPPCARAPTLPRALALRTAFRDAVGVAICARTARRLRRALATALFGARSRHDAGASLVRLGFGALLALRRRRRASSWRRRAARSSASLA